MWTDDQRARYVLIEAFRLDDLGSQVSFTDRLAREQQWSLRHALRVVAEYKRFCFLAVAAGHPVTPSDAVDEAWHLHLLYSRSYWDEFCPHVLGQSLHHGPTRGGAAEHHKHSDWYARTLASYRRFFGEPPADIWPPANARFSPHDHHVRVNRRDVWLVPKRPVRIAAGSLAMAAVIAAAIGWGPLLLGQWNPLDWRGPDFLALFVPLLVAAFLATFVCRWLVRGDQRESNAAADLDAYDLAYLADGTPRMADTAIAGLVDAGHLHFSPEHKLLETGGRAPADGHEVEQAVYETVAAGGSLRNVRSAPRHAAVFIHERLEQAGLLLTSSQRWTIRLAPVALFGMLVLLGGGKILVGLEREKPVGILIFLTIAAAVLGCYLAYSIPRRTVPGDRLLAAMKQRREKHEPLPTSPATATSADLMLGVALLGGAALTGAVIPGLADFLRPPDNHSWMPHHSSGCGSGCGGGGGGCGGGGCGGCGGD